MERMGRAVLRSNGELTLPREVRRALRLKEGDSLDVFVVEDGILLRPQKAIDASQAWFWEPEWQAGEREASAEYGAGRGRKLGSSEEFLRSLE